MRNIRRQLSRINEEESSHFKLFIGGIKGMLLFYYRVVLRWHCLSATVFYSFHSFDSLLLCYIPNLDVYFRFYLFGWGAFHIFFPRLTTASEGVVRLDFVDPWRELRPKSSSRFTIRHRCKFRTTCAFNLKCLSTDIFACFFFSLPLFIFSAFFYVFMWGDDLQSHLLRRCRCSLLYAFRR